MLMVEGGMVVSCPSQTGNRPVGRERHARETILVMRRDPQGVDVRCRSVKQNGAPTETRRWGVRVAESGVEPPRTIPNRVVPGASAGEYCAGDRVGGEAVARTPQRLGSTCAPVSRGGAVAARWAHNPKVAGSNPAPATPDPLPPIHPMGGSALTAGNDR